MGNTGRVILPTHESAEELETIFGDIYIDKVATIRRNINIGNPSDIYETALDDDVMFDGIPLKRFLPATHDEVKRIITNSPNKTRDLDPIPTRRLRQCLDHFVPLITAIINKSLAMSVVPACFKRAVVRPLLKRPGLDKEVLNNYRPVSSGGLMVRAPACRSRGRWFDSTSAVSKLGQFRSPHFARVFRKRH